MELENRTVPVDKGDSVRLSRTRYTDKTPPGQNPLGQNPLGQNPSGTKPIQDKNPLGQNPPTLINKEAKGFCPRGVLSGGVLS